MVVVTRIGISYVLEDGQHYIDIMDGINSVILRFNLAEQPVEFYTFLSLIQAAQEGERE